MKNLFKKFFEIVKEKLSEDKILKADIETNTVEISKYVMFNLHSVFFGNEK